MTTTKEMIERVARIIEPDWFGLLPDGTHVLDNYPGQHKHYQEGARARARAACAVAVEMCAEIAFNDKTVEWHEICDHPVGYFDGRSDVEAALRILAIAIKGE